MNNELSERINNLFLGSGYRKVKLSKFENYELYLENRDFLDTNNIVSFTDLDGSLLALRHDITLSILKGGLNGYGRVFYNELVCRNGGTHFVENLQTGVECIGVVDLVKEAEILNLAISSLRLISEDYNLSLSSLDIMNEVFLEIGVDETVRRSILEAFITKNKNRLNTDSIRRSVSDAGIKILSELIEIHLSLYDGIERLKTIGNIADKESFKRLISIYELLEIQGNTERLYLDFSIVNSMDYYNGIIFQGAVSHIPFNVLQGGRYDKLATKMGKNLGAMGFGIDIELVENYSENSRKIPIDVCVIYTEDTELKEVQEIIARQRRENKSTLSLLKGEDLSLENYEIKEVIELDWRNNDKYCTPQRKNGKD